MEGAPGSGQVTTRVENGQVVAIKTASGRAAAAQLAHEHRVLASFPHRGIVEALRFHHVDETTAELVTVFAGHRTLADHRPTGARQVAELLAAIAGTVADLHAAGIAHGGLDPDHVILSPELRPVLCSFGHATEPHETATAATATAADVAALGELVGTSVARRPPPSRGLWPRRRPASAAESTIAAALADLARRAGSDGEQLDAAEMAAALSRAAGADSSPVTKSSERDLPAAAMGSPVTGPTQSWRSRVPVTRRHWEPTAFGARITLAVAVAFALLLGLGLRAGRATSPSSSAPPVRPTAAPTERDCNPDGPDIDGDGCADDIEVLGGQVRVGSHLITTGSADDVVVLGDWDCDGTDTMAVLRPADGDVFVFSSWPDPDADVVAVAVGRYPSATTLSASASRDGCTTLTVVGVEAEWPIDTGP